MNVVIFLISRTIFWFKARWMWVMLCLGAALWCVVFALPKLNETVVVFCDVGQGDAVLVQQGFRQVLIDSGSGDRVLNCLSRHLPIGDRLIDVVVATHAQDDHAGGLVELLPRYHVGQFLYNGRGSTARFWATLSRQLYDQHIPVHILAQGDHLKFGLSDFVVLWPKRSSIAGSELDDTHLGAVLGAQDLDDPNVNALTMRMDSGGFHALFTADIGSSEEQALISAQELSPVSVLKVAHHGSRFSSTDAFLAAVRPMLAVISVGKNSYGHPAPEALERLKSIRAQVMRTDKDGDVVVHVKDGKWWTEK